MELEIRLHTVDAYIKQISKAVNQIEKTLRKVDFSQSDIKRTVKLLDMTKIYVAAIHGYIAEKPRSLSIPKVQPQFAKIHDGTLQILESIKDTETALAAQGMGGIHFAWANAIADAQELQTILADFDAALPELILE